MLKRGSRKELAKESNEITKSIKNRLAKITKLLDSKADEDMIIGLELLNNFKLQEIRKFLKPFRIPKKGDDATYIIPTEKRSLRPGGYVIIIKNTYFVEFSSDCIYIDHMQRAKNRINTGKSEISEQLLQQIHKS